MRERGIKKNGTSLKAVEWQKTSDICDAFDP